VKEVKVNHFWDLPMERVPGLVCDPGTDTFTYRRNFHKVKEEISSGAVILTKRSSEVGDVHHRYVGIPFPFHHKGEGPPAVHLQVRGRLRCPITEC
jgi:hypothetical protein